MGLMQTRKQVVGAVLIALLFVLCSIIMLITAYSYSRASGLFPRMAGWIFLSLSMLEFLIQIKSFMAIPSPLAGGNRAAAMDDKGNDRYKGVKGILWLAFMLAMLYVVGFVIATPVFVFAFLRISAGNSTKRSAVIAAITTGFVYLVFSKLLNYELFPGVLFQ